jgi:hypothetical protein
MQSGVLSDKTSKYICSAFGSSTLEDIFKPYVGKNISVTVEKKEGKIRKIDIKRQNKRTLDNRAVFALS